jgi:hypothetical protein
MNQTKLMRHGTTGDGEGDGGGVHIVLVPYKKRKIAALRQCEKKKKNRRKN